MSCMLRVQQVMTHLGLGEVLGIMVHPQHVHANLSASWQSETTQLRLLTRLSNLHQQVTILRQGEVEDCIALPQHMRFEY